MPNYEITMDVEDSGSGTIVDPTQLNDAGNAKRAEAWAVGQRNGVDVPSTDPTYHNNSKYYAQQAGSSAGSASSSADAAAAAAQHYPYVDSTSGNWMVWDTSTGAFVDTGVHAQGPTGPTGPGVPSGGTAGQVLKKVNGTDFNTEWTNNDGTTIPMSSSDATTLNAAITSQNEAILNNAVNRQATVADCNDASIGAGCFRIISSTINAPFSNSYGVLFNMFGNDYRTQIVIQTASSRMYFRRYVSTWGDWVELAYSSIKPSVTTPVSIPSSGTSVTCTMAGITSNHELIRWNFSSSAENNPPANLTWTTANGSFTITNNGGTTSETIRPVFALPASVAVTAST